MLARQCGITMLHTSSSRELSAASSKCGCCIFPPGVLIYWSKVQSKQVDHLQIQPHFQYWCLYNNFLVLTRQIVARLLNLCVFVRYFVQCVCTYLLCLFFCIVYSFVVGFDLTVLKAAYVWRGKCSGKSNQLESHFLIVV